jgi:hypothetical protein
MPGLQRALVCRHGRGHHRGHRGAAAGHGLCHRQRAQARSGLWTAIIGGFLVSLLGGTNVQIGGPAGAFIVIVYGIVERYGVANLLISTACGRAAVCAGPAAAGQRWCALCR